MKQEEGLNSTQPDRNREAQAGRPPSTFTSLVVRCYARLRSLLGHASWVGKNLLDLLDILDHGDNFHFRSTAGLVGNLRFPARPCILGQTNGSASYSFANNRAHACLYSEESTSTVSDNGSNP